MKRKLSIFFVVIVAAAISLTVVRLALRSRAQGPGPEYVPRENRLQWYAQRAKSSGKYDIEVPGPNVDYPGSSPKTDLDNALSVYSLVVAQPVQEYTFTGDDEIITCYKFHVLQTLVNQSTPACPGCYPPVPPPEFHLQANDDFAASLVGGTVVIDGVKVVMNSSVQLHLGTNYLLFISKYPTGGALIGAGPDGVFTIDDVGNISPLRRSSQHPIQRDIKEKLGNSLDRLRAYIQNRHALR